ncbi:MAG: hypothetical protein PVF87_00795 [Acidimicrobiia bacterium]
MRRHSILALFAVVLISACSQQGADPTGNTTPTTTTGDAVGMPDDSGATATTAPAPTTTAPSDTTQATSDRPVAPDFNLELGEGGSYTLSEGAKPVYLVFWAEW